jgi:pimeloyl-ACP methyl ester carboxylesterase
MKPQFAESIDGAHIAYDVTGSGPALMLLHGAGKGRRDWHKLGYVERLQQDFSVIAVDLRGSGESSFLANIEDYTIEKIIADLHAVADACQVSRFAVWGYSLGGNIARYLGAWSNRVTSVAMIGVPFGPAVDEAFDQFINEFVAKWGPQADAYRAGGLNAEKRQSVIKGRIPVWVACFQAMRKWPGISPGEMQCPTLLLAGSKNKSAIQWIDANRDVLEHARVRVEIVDGLNHPQEFSQVVRVFPQVYSFLRSSHGI